jgi:hypothetical protein
VLRISAVAAAAAVALTASALPAGAGAASSPGSAQAGSEQPSAAVVARKRCKKGYKAKQIGRRVRCVRKRGATTPSTTTTYTGTVEGLSGITFSRMCSGGTCNWFLAVTVPLGPGCNAATMNGPGSETPAGRLTGNIGATDVKGKVTGSFTATTFTGKLQVLPPLPAACAGIPETRFDLKLTRS